MLQALRGNRSLIISWDHNPSLSFFNVFIKEIDRIKKNMANIRSAYEFTAIYGKYRKRL